MIDLLHHYSITFDAAAHRYERFGVAVDSVTSVLPYISNDWLDKNPSVMEKAGERGHRVARYIEEVEAMAADASIRGHTGIVGMSGPYSGAIVEHTESYRQFKADTGFKALISPTGEIASEMFVYHPAMGYAGRFDILGRCENLGNDVILIDVKASALIPKTVGWQTAAYFEAYNKNASLYCLPKAKKRACLHLNPKLYKCGYGYRLEPLSDPNDFGSFACLLGAHRLARRLNLELKFEPIARNPGQTETFASPEETFV